MESNFDQVHQNGVYIWAASWQNQQNDSAPSEDSDQPGHPPRLIRVFAVRMKKAWALSFPMSAQWRLLSDWTDAEADLSLRWAHMPHCWFCHEVAHLTGFPVKVNQSLIKVTLIVLTSMACRSLLMINLERKIKHIQAKLIHCLILFLSVLKYSI